MNKGKTKAVLYPFLMTVIGSVLMLLMLVLPFASADSDYKERLMKYEDEMYMEEIGMTNKQAVNISLAEFLKMYAEAAKQDTYRTISIVCIAVISVFAAFAALTLLLSLLKKPIAIIIFDLLTMAAFRVVHFDFEDRGVIPSSKYEWGMVNYMTYIIGIVILVGAVWLFIEKRKAKKLAKEQPEVLVQE